MSSMKHHSDRRRRPGFLSLAVLILCLGAGVFCLYLFWNQYHQDENPEPASSASADLISSAPESSLPSAPVQSSSEPSSESSAPSSGEQTPEKSSDTSSEASSAESLPELPPYDFSQPVPESEAVGADYFNDALFIGDSRTQGFILYSGLADTTAYADRGLSVEKVFSKKIIRENGEAYTVAEALEHHPDTFKKVYLMFGINELGWQYPDIFQQRYREIVRKIKETQTDAVIYVQSILPVSKGKSDSDTIFTMSRIEMFNDLLKTMTEEEKVCYLDVSQDVSDEKGFLPDNASTDGIHLNKLYCELWLDYLKTHTALIPPEPAEETGSGESGGNL